MDVQKFMKASKKLLTDTKYALGKLEIIHYSYYLPFLFEIPISCRSLYRLYYISKINKMLIKSKLFGLC